MNMTARSVISSRIRSRISEQPDFEIQELLPHIQFTPFLRSLAADIIGEETNPLEKARRIYDYITTTIKYSYMKEYFMLQCIPEYCAVNRKVTAVYRPCFSLPYAVSQVFLHAGSPASRPHRIPSALMTGRSSI